MEDLFKEDRTINVGATLSSMINSEINNQESSTSSLPSTTKDEHTTNTVHSDIDYAHSEITENISENSVRCVKKFIKSNSYVYDWLKNCVHNFDLYDIENNNNFDKNIIASVKLKEQLLVSYSHVLDISSKQNSSKKKEKATKSRAMYNLRKMIRLRRKKS